MDGIFSLQKISNFISFRIKWYLLSLISSAEVGTSLFSIGEGNSNSLSSNVQIGDPYPFLRYLNFCFYIKRHLHWASCNYSGVIFPDSLGFWTHLVRHHNFISRINKEDNCRSFCTLPKVSHLDSRPQN